MKFFKFFALALCVCVIPMFAGCTLVTTNLDKQLSEWVVSFDNNRITVTREELLITYNSTGNAQFDNSSTVTENGIRSTIDLELKRKLLVDFLTSDDEDMVEARAEKKIDKVALTTYQFNEVWQNVYDYINDTVGDLEQELRGGTTTTESDESDSTYTSYEDSLYQSQYDLVEGVLTKNKEEVEVANKSIGLYTEADVESKSFSELAKLAYDTFRANYWHWTDSIVMNPDASNEESFSDDAWSKYINNLLRNENGRNLTKTGTDAFLRNVQMVYKIYYQNAVLTAFQNKYTEDNIVITNKDVVDKYKELYNAQVEKYNTSPSAFNNDVATGAGDVYYMKDATGYFKVNHILIKFSDEQNKAMEAEKTKLENCEIDLETYNTNIQNIKMQTMATNKATGEQIPYEDLNTKLEKIGSLSSASAKIAKFAELMHLYSDDEATLGAEACYYVPVSAETKSSFVDAFVEGSREVYNNGKGKVGDITTHWIETSYGYHVIMYTGMPTNVDANDSEQNLLIKLNAYRLNPLYNKTMLDKVIEQITLASYSDFEESLIDYLMAGKEIVYYPGSFSDLYS